MRMMRLAAPVLATMMIAVPIAPAAAEKRDFAACDGRSAPGRKDGGIGNPAQPDRFGSLFAAAGNSQMTATVAACNKALVDPLLLPEHGLRRAHLLRARGFAYLELRNADKALADFDAATIAAGPLMQDPLFVRSMGVSFTLGRAVAAHLKGDRATTRALAAAASAARPFSSTIQAVALVIAQAARDPAAINPAPPAPLAALLPLSPTARTIEFRTDMAEGRFAKAVMLYPLLDIQYPPATPYNFGFLGPRSDNRALIESVVISSDAAYAFAATSNNTRAKAILDDMREQVEKALIPGVDKKGITLPVSDLAEPLRGVIARATILTEARIAINQARAADAMKALIGTALPINASSVELLTALKKALPEAQKALAPDPAQMSERLAAERRAESLDVKIIRRAMPVPETSRTLADYGKSSSGLVKALFGPTFAADGFKSGTDATTGITRVEFVGQSTSQAAVEELTLLRAADLARAAGKPGLLIVDRNDYTRTLTTTYGYSHTPLSSRPAGFKTELNVRFVDPAALPADLSTERDRIIDANRVYATLAPIYIAPSAAKE